jgi:hypothetical protein
VPPPPGEPARAPAPVPGVAAEAPAAAAEDKAKRIEVPYVDHVGRAKRIIVSATLNGSVTARLAVDTGAPGSMISVGLADRVGVLRADDGRLLIAAGGIGGAAPAVLVVLNSLALGAAHDEFVPTTVADVGWGDFDGLIGMDFMARYEVNIDTRRHVLVLTERPPDRRAPAGHEEGWWRRWFEEFNAEKTQWTRYCAALDAKLGNSLISAGAGIERLKQLRAVAEYQRQEADKLLSRLDRYASQNSVPREWR